MQKIHMPHKAVYGILLKEQKPYKAVTEENPTKILPMFFRFFYVTALLHVFTQHTA